MKSFIIILFLIGLIFFVYGYRNIEDIQKINMFNVNDSKLSSENKIDKSIYQQQFNPSPNLKSFYENIFDSKSLFLTYPFGSTNYFLNTSMDRKDIKDKRFQILNIKNNLTKQLEKINELEKNELEKMKEIEKRIGQY